MKQLTFAATLFSALALCAAEPAAQVPEKAAAQVPEKAASQVPEKAAAQAPEKAAKHRPQAAARKPLPASHASTPEENRARMEEHMAKKMNISVDEFRRRRNEQMAKRVGMDPEAWAKLTPKEQHEKVRETHRAKALERDRKAAEKAGLSLEDYRKQRADRMAQMRANRKNAAPHARADKPGKPQASADRPEKPQDPADKPEKPQTPADKPPKP